MSPTMFDSITYNSYNSISATSFNFFSKIHRWSPSVFDKDPTNEDKYKACADIWPDMSQPGPSLLETRDDDDGNRCESFRYAPGLLPDDSPVEPRLLAKMLENAAIPSIVATVKQENSSKENDDHSLSSTSSYSLSLSSSDDRDDYWSFFVDTNETLGEAFDTLSTLTGQEEDSLIEQEQGEDALIGKVYKVSL